MRSELDADGKCPECEAEAKAAPQQESAAPAVLGEHVARKKDLGASLKQTMARHEAQDQARAKALLDANRIMEHAANRK
jgi:hypothetical protein